MEYLFVILATIIALSLHWHYYRWCIFNIRSNRPHIYWSYKGVSIVFISKIILFGVIALFFNWYLIFIPFIFFQILKFMAFSISLKSETREYFIFLGKKLLEEKGVLKEQFINNSSSRKIRDFIENNITKEKMKEIQEEAKEIAKNEIFEYKNKKLSGSFLSKIFYYIT